MRYSIFYNKVSLLQVFSYHFTGGNIYVICAYCILFDCQIMWHVDKSQNNLLILTCILSLLLISTTSFPYSILAILAMILHLMLASITLPSPELTGNIVLTYKMAQLDVLQSFLRLILTMPNTSSPLGRLRMPLRSLKSSSKSPASLSHFRQLEITWKGLVWRLWSRQKGLSSLRGIEERGWILLWPIRTGQWRTGRLLYGLMKLKPTG